MDNLKLSAGFWDEVDIDNQILSVKTKNAY